MSKIIFRGATIDRIKSYCTKAGHRTVEIAFRAAWTDTVCEEMNWQLEPTGFGNGALEGKLAGKSMAVIPNGVKLKDYGFDIPINTVEKFKHVAEVEDGDVVSRHLRFVVKTISDDAPLVLDNWLKNVGPSDSLAQVTVQYNTEEQMPLVDPSAPETTEAAPRGRRKATADGAVQ